MSEAMTRSMQCPSIMIIYQNCYCGSAIIAMSSWDVVNGAPLQWRLAEGGLSLLVFIIYNYIYNYIVINFKPNEQTVLYILHCFTHMHVVQIATTPHWVLRFFRNHTTHTASILYHQSTSIYTQVPTTHKCINLYNFVQS